MKQSQVPNQMKCFLEANEACIDFAFFFNFFFYTCFSIKVCRVKNMIRCVLICQKANWTFAQDSVLHKEACKSGGCNATNPRLLVEHASVVLRVEFISICRDRCDKSHDSRCQGSYILHSGPNESVSEWPIYIWG